MNVWGCPRHQHCTRGLAAVLAHVSNIWVCASTRVGGYRTWRGWPLRAARRSERHPTSACPVSFLQGRLSSYLITCRRCCWGHYGQSTDGRALTTAVVIRSSELRAVKSATTCQRHLWIYCSRAQLTQLSSVPIVHACCTHRQSACALHPQRSLLL